MDHQRQSYCPIQSHLSLKNAMSHLNTQFSVSTAASCNLHFFPSTFQLHGSGSLYARLATRLYHFLLLAIRSVSVMSHV